MRIAMDFDGTITAMPEFLAAVSQMPEVMRAIVVTGHDAEARPEISGFLRACGIRCDEIYTIDRTMAAAELCPHTDLDWLVALGSVASPPRFEAGEYPSHYDDLFFSRISGVRRFAPPLPTDVIRDAGIRAEREGCYMLIRSTEEMSRLLEVLSDAEKRFAALAESAD